MGNHKPKLSSNAHKAAIAQTSSSVVAPKPSGLNPAGNCNGVSRPISSARRRAERREVEYRFAFVASVVATFTGMLLFAFTIYFLLQPTDNGGIADLRTEILRLEPAVAEAQSRVRAAQAKVDETMVALNKAKRERDDRKEELRNVNEPIFRLSSNHGGTALPDGLDRLRQLDVTAALDRYRHNGRPSGVSTNKNDRNDTRILRDDVGSELDASAESGVASQEEQISRDVSATRDQSSSEVEVPATLSPDDVLEVFNKALADLEMKMSNWAISQDGDLQHVDRLKMLVEIALDEMLNNSNESIFLELEKRTIAVNGRTTARYAAESAIRKLNAAAVRGQLLRKINDLVLKSAEKELEADPIWKQIRQIGGYGYSPRFSFFVPIVEAMEQQVNLSEPLIAKNIVAQIITLIDRYSPSPMAPPAPAPLGAFSDSAPASPRLSSADRPVGKMTNLEFWEAWEADPDLKEKFAIALESWLPKLQASGADKVQQVEDSQFLPSGKPNDFLDPTSPFNLAFVEIALQLREIGYLLEGLGYDLAKSMSPEGEQDAPIRESGYGFSYVLEPVIKSAIETKAAILMLSENLDREMFDTDPNRIENQKRIEQQLQDAQKAAKEAEATVQLWETEQKTANVQLGNVVQQSESISAKLTESSTSLEDLRNRPSDKSLQSTFGPLVAAIGAAITQVIAGTILFLTIRTQRMLSEDNRKVSEEEDLLHRLEIADSIRSETIREEVLAAIATDRARHDNVVKADQA